MRSSRSTLSRIPLRVRARCRDVVASCSFSSAPVSRQGHLLRVIEPQPQPVTRVEPRQHLLQRRAQHVDEPRAVRVAQLPDSTGGHFVRQRLGASIDTHAVHMALREDGTEPCGKTAAPVEVAQQRLTRHRPACRCRRGRRRSNRRALERRLSDRAPPRRDTGRAASPGRSDPMPQSRRVRTRMRERGLPDEAMTDRPTPRAVSGSAPRNALSQLASSTAAKAAGDTCHRSAFDARYSRAARSAPTRLSESAIERKETGRYRDEAAPRCSSRLPPLRISAPAPNRAPCARQRSRR